MTDLVPGEIQELSLGPTLEGTAAATQRARNRPLNLRPATVVTVSPDRDSVTIIDDTNQDGMPTGATNISGHYLAVGDRVMVMTYPPHGALVVGKRRGGYVGWTYASDDAPDTVGNIGTGWTNDNGTGVLDTDLPPFISWRRNNNVAELQGRATRVSGSAVRIVWLPGGFRPRNDKIFAVATAPIATPGLIQVKRNGEVLALSGVIDFGSGGFITLDGVHFSVD